jgi:hypothetical protein
MHIEILVEDSSGKALLDILVPKIINPDENSWNIHGLPIQLKQALHPLVSPACFGPIR